MSLEDLDLKELDALRNSIKASREAESKKEVFRNYGSYDQMGDEDIAGREAEIKARIEAESKKEVYQDHGSVENLGLKEQELQAKIIKQVQYDNASRGAFQHYGSVENMGDTRHLEHQTTIQRVEDSFAIDYLKKLQDDPRVFNDREFSEAIARGIQSNRVLNVFHDGFMKSFQGCVQDFSQVDNNDYAFKDAKQDLENRLGIYGKFIYELKKQDANVDYGHLKFPDELKENLWKQQRNRDITFEMPIPTRVNGRQPFELMGDAVSVLNYMNGYTNEYQGRILGENLKEQDMDM